MDSIRGSLSFISPFSSSIISGKKKKTDIFEAIQQNRFKEFCNILRRPSDRTAWMNKLDDDTFSPLHWCIICNRPKFAEELIRKRCNLEIRVGFAPRMEKMTPLHLAVYFDRVDIVKLLLHKGVKKYQKDKRKKYPFDYISSKELSEIMFVKPTNGKVEYFFESGERYVGHWKDGKKHGDGILYHPNGTMKYDGQWKNGNRHGDGTSYYFNGKVEFTGYDEYTKKEIHGKWKNDLYHGQSCILYRDDGVKKYFGNFQKGEFQGLGDLYERKYHSNKVYKYYSGQFKGGRMHGLGEMFHPNGKMMYEGKFKDGKFEGEGILYNEKGKKKSKGFFSNGKYMEKMLLPIPDNEIVKNIVELDVTNKKEFKFKKRLNVVGASAENILIYKWKSKKINVVVKKFKNNDDDFFTALNIFNKLEVNKHPNIIRFFGFCRILNFVSIVIEHCPHSLKSYITKKKFKNFDHKVDLLMQVAKGIRYLHEEHEIIHRDIKPENLLVDESGNIKVIDFALSKKIIATQNFNFTLNIGTPMRIAPELIKGAEQVHKTVFAEPFKSRKGVKLKKNKTLTGLHSGIYNYKVDIFSFGMIMFQILFETLNPFQAYPNAVVTDKRIAEVPNFRPIVKVSELKKMKLILSNDEKLLKEGYQNVKWFIQLMQYCWNSNPSLRPSSSELVKTFESKCDYGEVCSKVIKKKMENLNEQKVRVKKKEEDFFKKNQKKEEAIKEREEISVKVKEIVKAKSERKEHLIKRKKEIESEYTKLYDEKKKKDKNDISEIKRLKSTKSFLKKKIERINKIEKKIEREYIRLEERIEKEKNNLKENELRKRCIDTSDNCVVCLERIPVKYYCKISGVLLNKPCVLKYKREDDDEYIEDEEGYIYEKMVLEKWFEENELIHPVLMEKVKEILIVDCLDVKKELNSFIDKNEILFDD